MEAQGTVKFSKMSELLICLSMSSLSVFLCDNKVARSYIYIYIWLSVTGTGRQHGRVNFTAFGRSSEGRKGKRDMRRDGERKLSRPKRSCAHNSWLASAWPMGVDMTCSNRLQKNAKKQNMYKQAKS